MIGALPQTRHLGVGEGQRPWGIPHAKRGRGARSPSCAQGGRRMVEKEFPINGRVGGWRGFPLHGRKMDLGVGGRSPWFSPLPWGGGAVRVSPLHGVGLKGLPPHAGAPSSVLTELAAGRAEPALGSLPGMGFLGEVPAGKGCSLNRWGRPIAFLEGSSSDSPMWPPLK